MNYFLTHGLIIDIYRWILLIERRATCVVLNKRLVVLNTTSFCTISYEPVDPLLWAACMWNMKRDPRSSVGRLEVQ